jgi:hypothetical protein
MMKLVWAALILVGAAGAAVPTMLRVRRNAPDVEPGVGSLRPVAMERTLGLIDQQLAVAGQREPPPCDASGSPR